MNVQASGFRAQRAYLRRPGKRAETKARNREAILDAARIVFAERGYGAATVRDVIRATPLAPGTFYNYFKSKDELFQALREAAAETMAPALREARRSAATPEAFIAGAFRSFFDHAAANRKRFAAAKRTGALPLRADAPEMLAAFAELREDIEGAMAKGILPALDAEYLSAAMMGVAFELAEAMLKRERPDAEAAARFATRLFLHGAAAPKPKT